MSHNIVVRQACMDFHTREWTRQPHCCLAGNKTGRATKRDVMNFNRVTQAVAALAANVLHTLASRLQMEAVS